MDSASSGPADVALETNICAIIIFRWLCCQCGSSPRIPFKRLMTTSVALDASAICCSAIAIVMFVAVTAASGSLVKSGIASLSVLLAIR